MIYLLALSITANVALVVAFLKVQTETFRKRDKMANKERQHLLNRIQAPQVAIAESVETSDEPRHISPFDDEALYEYAQERKTWQ